MTITQTVKIPANRRIILEVPREIPVGHVILTFTPKTTAYSFDASLEDFKGKTAFGCLHQFANPALISDEKGAWKRAVLEKHAKN